MLFGTFVPEEVLEARSESQRLMDELTATTSRLLSEARAEASSARAELAEARSALASSQRASKARLAEARSALAAAVTGLENERALSSGLEQRLRATEKAEVDVKLICAYLDANMLRLHDAARGGDFEELCVRVLEWLTSFREGGLDLFLKDSHERIKTTRDALR